MRFPIIASFLALLLTPITTACLVFSGTESRGYLDAEIYDNGQRKCWFHNLLLRDREEYMQCNAPFYAWMNLHREPGGRHHGVITYAYNGLNFRFNVDSTHTGDCTQWGEGLNCLHRNWELSARVFGSSAAAIAALREELGRMGRWLRLERLSHSTRVCRRSGLVSRCRRLMHQSLRRRSRRSLSLLEKIELGYEPSRHHVPYLGRRDENLQGQWEGKDVTKEDVYLTNRE